MLCLKKRKLAKFRFIESQNTNRFSQQEGKERERIRRKSKRKKQLQQLSMKNKKILRFLDLLFSRSMNSQE